MISTKKTIALIGATGNLGPSIAKALLDKKETINLIILTRKVEEVEKKKRLEEFKLKGALIKELDLENVDELAKALNQVEVLISAVGIEKIPWQIKLVEAAKKANVKRFIPSEYGFPNDTKQLEGLEFIEERKKIVRAARNAGLETLTIATGLFPDMLFTPFHGWEWKEGKAVIYDKLSKKLALTSRKDVGKIVTELALKDKLPNNDWKLAGDLKSMEDILKIVEKLSGKKFKPITLTEEELKKKLDANKKDPVAQIKWGLAAGACDFEPINNKSLTETKLETFEECLKELIQKNEL